MNSRLIDEKINIGRWRKYINDSLCDKMDRDYLMNCVEEIGEYKSRIVYGEYDVLDKLERLKIEINGILCEDFDCELQSAIDFIRSLK